MDAIDFEELLQVRLEELPYTKHLDDGQYNDGQAYGFECGARWAYEKLSSGIMIVEPPKTVEDFEKVRLTILELMANPFCDQFMLLSVREKLDNVDSKIVELKAQN